MKGFILRRLGMKETGHTHTCMTQMWAYQGNPDRDSKFLCESPQGVRERGLRYFKHYDFILLAEADRRAPSIHVTTGEGDPDWKPLICPPGVRAS